MAKNTSRHYATPKDKARAKRSSLQGDGDDLATLRKEYRKLQLINTDLAEQVRSLLAAHPMTDEQLSEFKSIRQQHDAMNEEQNEIALFFRRNFEGEIARGEHQGLTLSQCVNRYLGRYKAMVAEREQERMGRGQTQ